MKLPLRDYGNEPHQLRPEHHTGLDWLWAHCKLGHVGWTMLLGLASLLVAFGYVTDTQAQSNNGTFLSRLTLGNPTGPTPAAGQENAQNPYLINGTPVVPNCTDNKIIVEDNSSGFNAAIKCNSAFLTTATPSNNSTLKVNAGNLVEFNTATPTFTPIPTVTPIPPVATATPIPSQIAGVISTSTPSAGTVLFFPGAQGTPGIYVTVAPTATAAPVGATATPELYLQATTATPAPNTFLNYAGTPGPAKWVTAVPTATAVSTATPQPTSTVGAAGTNVYRSAQSLTSKVTVNCATSYADIDSTNLSGTITTHGGDVHAIFTTAVDTSATGQSVFIDFALDGTDKTDSGNVVVQGVAATFTSITVQYLFIAPSAASHSFRPRWRCSNTTGTADLGTGTNNQASYLTLVEYKG